MAGEAAADDHRVVVRRAIDFVRSEQRPTGEFPSVAAFLDGEPQWEEDTLVFVTALTVLALDRLPAELDVAAIAERATGFLEGERGPSAQWRYWSRNHERHTFTPPDADDTACVSMALNQAGISTSANVAVLLANRDHDGRFFTWLVLHRPLPRDPRAWWALRREVGAHRRRQDLWRDTEAEHADVDGVVNANVIRYLGHRAPTEAVGYVTALVADGREHGCDSWYHSPCALYAAIADGARRGVERFAALGEIIEQRITALTRSDGSTGSPLETALALQSLADLGRMSHARPLLRSLVETQREDGSWERSVCYHGGPQETFGWASDALTAATAAAALSSAASALRAAEHDARS